MKKATVVLGLLALCTLCICFAFRQDIGASINDQYKQALLEHYFAPSKTADLNVLEYATFCGNEEDSGTFVVWVGIAVQSDLPYEQFGLLLDKIYEKTLGMEYFPYDMEFANSHGFTGIQKETEGGNTVDGCYIPGITFEPKTSIDLRNRN